MNSLDGRNGGFTLIELMIVVVIIGVLAAIAIPRYQAVAESSKQAEAGPVLKQMCSLAEIIRIREGSYPTTLGELDGWAEPSAAYFSFDYAAGVATATAGGGTLGPQPQLANQSLDCATNMIM